MAIQVAQITGDTVELVFDPAEDDLHVGENLSLVERHDGRGLIVQLIELKTFFSASFVPNRRQQKPDAPQSTLHAITTPASRSPLGRKRRLSPRKGGGLHLAIAKIRKMTDPIWHPWDGWIPASDVIVTRTADAEMLRHCLRVAEHPLELGNTLAGEPFRIDRAALDRVNLITGTTGSGTSHLAKVMVGELIDQGFPCVIFDTEGAYTALDQARQSSAAGSEEGPAIIPLVAGENLRLGVQDLSPDTWLLTLRQFGLPKAIAMYFASHITRQLARPQVQSDADDPPSFLGVDDLLHLAQKLESEGQSVVAGAILSCLEGIKQTQMLATHHAEATAFWDSLARIRNGGALVINLARLPRRARLIIVQALVGLLGDFAKRETTAQSHPMPCLFFDEAQPLVSRYFFAEMVLLARQTGLTSFFVTTTVSHFEEICLHQTDNLFLLQVASDHDIRQLAKCALVDPDTLRTVVRRLRKHHCMLIGSATGWYPIIFAADPPGGLEMTARRAAVARTPAAARMEQRAPALPHVSTQGENPAETHRTLPLFPEDVPGLAVAAEPHEPQQMTAISHPPMPSIAQVTAAWEHIVKRVARRRRILETILAAARPLRIAQPKLVLGFPLQHRFQKELVDSEEYRSLLDEELQRTFGVRLEVTTELYPS